MINYKQMIILIRLEKLLENLFEWKKTDFGIKCWQSIQKNYLFLSLPLSFSLSLSLLIDR